MATFVGATILPLATMDRYRRLLSLTDVTPRTAEGAIGADEVVVHVLAGNGLTNPETAMRRVPPILEAEPTLKSVAARLGW